MSISKLKLLKTFLLLILFGSFLNGEGILSNKETISSLHSLLPEIDAWKFSETPENFYPGTLYEYINGAAEVYLAYDFAELIVAQYERGGSESSLLVEIYDMGNTKNSFGIYSVERFHDTKFISIGNQGYLEEGNLNFIVGKYYIKVFCFDCGEESDKFLKDFSQEVVKKVNNKGQIPPLIGVFPEEGLIQNSEKFILRNFMGYRFLHDGYLANYKLKDLEFDCFLVEGENEEDAQNMLRLYLKTKNKLSIEETSVGYHIKDRYYHNVYLARIGNYLCGVLKIKDGLEEVGERYFRILAESLKEAPANGFKNTHLLPQKIKYYYSAKAE